MIEYNGEPKAGVVQPSFISKRREESFRTWVTGWDTEWLRFLDRLSDRLVDRIWGSGAILHVVAAGEYDALGQEYRDQFIFPSAEYFLTAILTYETGVSDLSLRDEDRNKLQAAGWLWNHEYIPLFNGTQWHLHSARTGAVVSVVYTQRYDS